MVMPEDMVEVDGIRYRPDEVPQKAKEQAEVETKERPTVRNKARQPATKAE